MTAVDIICGSMNCIQLTQVKARLRSSLKTSDASGIKK